MEKIFDGMFALTVTGIAKRIHVCVEIAEVRPIYDCCCEVKLCVAYMSGNCRNRNYFAR